MASPDFIHPAWRPRNGGTGTAPTRKGAAGMPETEHTPDELLREIRDLGKRLADLVPAKPELKNLRKFVMRCPAATIGNVAAGQVIDQEFGPESYYFWDVRRITVNSFTAGSVSVYSAPGAAATDLENVWTQPGAWFIPGKGLPLEEGERLVFVAGTGFAGNLDISLRGYMVPRPLWAEYLS